MERDLPTGQAGPEPAVGEHQLQGVRDQVDRGLVRRDEDQPQVLQHLVVAELGVVLEQPRHQVGAGGGALALDQLAQRHDHVVVARDGGRGALHEVPRGLDQAGAVLLRHAQQLRHDEHRQVLRELVDQVRGPGRREAVYQLVGIAGDVAADPTAVEARQAVGHRSAEPLVLGPVGEDAQGLPADHRQQRRVGPDLVLLEGRPAARVPGVGGGGAHRGEVLPVAEDQPGGKVAVQENGRDGAVLRAQLLVQGRRVGLGLGPVEPAQPVRAQSVGGALRRRGQRGIAVGLARGRGGHDASVVTARTGGQRFCATGAARRGRPDERRSAGPPGHDPARTTTSSTNG